MKVYHLNSIKTARSALSTILTMSGKSNLGNNIMITRSLRGVFSLRPSLPRYSEIWNVSLVLNHIKTWQPLEDIDLKTLTDGKFNGIKEELQSQNYF